MLFVFTVINIENVNSGLCPPLSPKMSSNFESAVEWMSECIREIRNWVVTDKLMLHVNKTVFFSLGIRQQLAKVKS